MIWIVNFSKNLRKNISPKAQLSLLLPDIRSGFNVGAFFRTADALGLDHIFLTGLTPYPPHKEIAKTALGAEKSVAWSYHIDAEKLLKKLKVDGVHIIALERSTKAVALEKFMPKFPLCLIVGNEVQGIREQLMNTAEEIIEIPMRGSKESLNVSIAGSIALWELAKKQYN